jgi:uncharacterized protein YjaZ
MRTIGCLLVASLSSGCAGSGVDVVFYGAEGHRFSTAERRTIERIAGSTAAEVKQLLPALPDHITLSVEAGKNVIPEIGATASAGAPDTVQWTVDTDSHGGVEAIANAHLRSALFHEFHHLVREAAVPGRGRTVDSVVLEGMATAFERDFAGARPPWGMYPDDVDAWTRELLTLPPRPPRRDWMFQHPDGRRWIGYKVGTYLVDRAMRASGRSSADLVSVPTDEIVRLAQE